MPEVNRVSPIPTPTQPSGHALPVCIQRLAEMKALPAYHPTTTEASSETHQRAQWTGALYPNTRSALISDPNVRPEWREAEDAQMQTERAIPRPLQAAG